MDRHNFFLANKKDIVMYAGKDILNLRLHFQDIENADWNFQFAIGYTFKVWEEREGGLLMINWSSPTNLTLSTSEGGTLLLNAPSTDTNIGRGNYYYEIEYLLSGGYSVLIGFGRDTFI